jgi:hypothetical protein
MLPFIARLIAQDEQAAGREQHRFSAAILEPTKVHYTGRQQAQRCPGSVERLVIAVQRDALPRKVRCSSGRAMSWTWSVSFDTPRHVPATSKSTPARIGSLFLTRTPKEPKTRIKIAVNTDSHSIRELDFIHAGLTKPDGLGLQPEMF